MIRFHRLIENISARGGQRKTEYRIVHPGRKSPTPFSYPVQTIHRIASVAVLGHTRAAPHTNDPCRVITLFWATNRWHQFSLCRCVPVIRRVDFIALTKHDCSNKFVQCSNMFETVYTAANLHSTLPSVPTVSRPSPFSNGSNLHTVLSASLSSVMRSEYFCKAPSVGLATKETLPNGAIFKSTPRVYFRSLGPTAGAAAGSHMVAQEHGPKTSTLK